MKNLFLNIKFYIIKRKSQVVEKIGKFLLRNTLKISTAESCTGGLVSSRLTDIAGSSGYVTENYVTYSNEAKQKILNVSKDTLENFGAVSEQCAYEMAKGLQNLTKSDVVLCTTGVAGPSCSEAKPVGLIYIACGYKNQITVKKVMINEKYSRTQMKFVFSEEAFKILLETLENN